MDAIRDLLLEAHGCLVRMGCGVPVDCSATLSKIERELAHDEARPAERAPRDVELQQWLDGNTTFYDVHGHDTHGPNVPSLASVSKRIWYHATDDQTSYPFSAVAEAAIGRTQPIAPAEAVSAPPSADVAGLCRKLYVAADFYKDHHILAAADALTRLSQEARILAVIERNHPALVGKARHDAAMAERRVGNGL